MKLLAISTMPSKDEIDLENLHVIPLDFPFDDLESLQSSAQLAFVQFLNSKTATDDIKACAAEIFLERRISTGLKEMMKGTRLKEHQSAPCPSGPSLCYEDSGRPNVDGRNPPPFKAGQLDPASREQCEETEGRIASRELFTALTSLSQLGLGHKLARLTGGAGSKGHFEDRRPNVEQTRDANGVDGPERGRHRGAGSLFYRQCPPSSPACRPSRMHVEDQPFTPGRPSLSRPSTSHTRNKKRKRDRLELSDMRTDPHDRLDSPATYPNSIFVINPGHSRLPHDQRHYSHYSSELDVGSLHSSREAGREPRSLDMYRATGRASTSSYSRGHDLERSRVRPEHHFRAGEV